MRERVHSYLGGVIRGMGGTPLEVGGIADHVHLVIGLKPTHVLADVMRVLKGDSSKSLVSRKPAPEGRHIISRADVGPGSTPVPAARTRARSSPRVRPRP
ncbi:MAG: transposase [Thermoanaerobaculia bacterium]